MNELIPGRRAFLQTVVAGAAIAATAGVVPVGAESTMPSMKKGIFVCSVCGHVEFGEAPDACPVCHSPKEKFEQNDTVFSDAAAKDAHLTDKHTPILTVRKKSMLIPEAPAKEVLVRIGEKIHPMNEDHHIKFIDCYIDDKHVTRIMLTPGVYAAAQFELQTPGSRVRIVHLCNLHGYWQAEASLA